MITQEQKIAIYEEYKDPKNRVAAIAEKYGIQRSKVVRIAVEMGAEPRMPKRYDQKYSIKKGGGSLNRVCSKCKKHINIEGAKFCCFCGADIRTSKEITVEDLKKVMGVVLHLPINERDLVQQAILNAIKELEAKEGVK